MKKLFVILVAVLFSSGFVFAQDNTATIDQYGSNIGVVDQTGADNTGAIDQGTLATPVTNNHVPAYVGDWIHGAFIEQIGDRNDASIFMHDGGSNGSSIYQLGDDNEGYQDIGTSHSKWTSWSLMGVDLDQLGNNNWATQKTVYSFGSAGIKKMFVIQDGNYNVADQLSIGGYGNVQNIHQKGDNNNNPGMSSNTYDVSSTSLTDPLTLPWAHKPAGLYTQYANQMFGTTHMYVEGDGNNTHQYQEYTVWARSGRNDAWIDVWGDDNDVAQGQLGYMNYSDVDVTGDRNVVTTAQDGDDNIANMSVVGDDNIAAKDQVGNTNNGSISITGSGNVALETQTGNGNSIQHGGSFGIVITGDDNSNIAVQTGDGNSYNSIQTGNDNVATLTQTGDNNRANEGNRWHTFDNGTLIEMHKRGIYQIGNDNDADITSLGNRNQAAIDQRGDFNDAIIYQDDPTLNNWGANFSKIRQEGDQNNATSTATGRFNDAHTYQLGDNNTGDITQTGFGNDGEIYQVGNGNTGTITQSE